MNIFPLAKSKHSILSPSREIDWKLSARYHDNLRCNKMITETAQMLSTVINEIKGKNVGFYKSSHIKHPCVLWAKKSYTNFFDLIAYGQELHGEFFRRNNKFHKAGQLISDINYYFYNNLSHDDFELFERTKLPLCMPDEFKTDDVVESYRNYWCSKNKMIYNINEIPDWFKQKRKIPFKVKLKNKKGKSVIITVKTKNETL